MTKTNKSNVDSAFKQTMVGVAVRVMVLCAIVIGIALWVEHAREEMAISADVGRMTQIRLAIECYADMYNCSPLNATDVTVSWRVELLQFGDHDSAKLYAQYDRTQPWDSFGNARVMGACPRWWCSELHSAATDVVRVVDVREGRARTFVVMMRRVKSSIEWTRPFDMTRTEFRQHLQRLLDEGKASAHQRFVILNGDGSIRTVTLASLLEDSGFE